MDSPCMNCDTRRAYAHMFDMHISGDDCPYICKEWDEYKAQAKHEEGKQE